jgi:hypothetical protein
LWHQALYRISVAYFLRWLEAGRSSSEFFLGAELAMAPLNGGAAGPSTGRDVPAAASTTTKRNKPRCNLSSEKQISFIFVILELFIFLKEDLIFP